MSRTFEPLLDATLPPRQSELEDTEGAQAPDDDQSPDMDMTFLGSLKFGWSDPASLDDDDADIVMVFPRQLEPDRCVDEPWKRAKAVFPDLQDTGELAVALKFDSMPNSEYHEVIRREIVRRLADAGFKLGSFTSIDKDEAFLKINLSRSGELIRQLAQKFQYWMPFKREAYEAFIRMQQRTPRGKLDEYGCPLDDTGNPVPAHQPYSLDQRDAHADFVDVDAKRIALVRISELMSLSKLKKQKLILFWFVASHHEPLQELSDKLCGCSRFFQLPSLEDANTIRAYFGERVAFFFQWNAFFTSQLAWVAGFLALIGIVSIVHPLDRNANDILKLMVIGLLIIWAELCKRCFSRISARSVQKWGMKDYRTRVDFEMPSYDPTLDRTMRLAMQKMFVYLCLLAFCGAFVGLILMCYQDLLRPAVQSAVTVVLIRLGYPVWSTICTYLVELQNNRTQQEYDDALTFLVSGVKVFTTLFPFLHLAFIKRFENTCGTSFEAIVPKVYCSETDPPHNCLWPSLFSKNSSLSLSGEKDISQIFSIRNDIFSWNTTESGSENCISGCYPTSCEVYVADGELQYHCLTNCGDMLRDNFQLLYAIHLLSTILFLLIPHVRVTYATYSEERKMRKCAEDSGDTFRHSTFLEKQAKRHRFAEYTFLSWGGSEVEDSLELAISFLLLTCFGTLYPALGIFAFVCHCVEYRLLVKRMIFLTSRPFPYGAEGIGIWQAVLSWCIRIAVLVNGGLAVFFLDPIRHYDTQDKLVLFLVFENTLFLLMSLVPSLDPDDVKDIDVYNQRFLAWHRAKDPVKVPENERQIVDDIDIGLGGEFHERP